MDERYNRIIIHRDEGLANPGPRAYLWTVDYRCRLSIQAEQYALGKYPANYQVPMVRT